MLFLTMFFFFMSQNGQNQPLGTIGPDGEIRERVTELSLMRQQVKEYEGFLNGTGNWTEVSVFMRGRCRLPTVAGGRPDRSCGELP